MLTILQFMQRAAGAAGSKAPETSSKLRDHPTKRVRLSNGSSASPRTSSSYDYEAVQAAMAAEELKRSQAIERQAAEAGETRWVLSFQDPDAGENDVRGRGLNIRRGGFADIDRNENWIHEHDAANDQGGAEDREEGSMASGRRIFGKTKPAEVSAKGHTTSDAESGDSVESDVGYDPEDPSAGIALQTDRIADTESHAKRRMRKERGAWDASKATDVDFSKLTSTTNVGGKSADRKSTKRGLSFAKDVACYLCGRKGHMKRDCPESSKPADRRGNFGLQWGD